MAASSPLKDKRGPARLGDLAGEPMIAFRQCRSCESLETYMTSRGAPPNVVFRSDDNGTVLGMVAAGMGIALMPRLTVEQQRPGIVIVDVGEDIPPRRIGLWWHCDRSPSPAARAFTEAARRVSSTIAGANAGELMLLGKESCHFMTIALPVPGSYAGPCTVPLPDSVAPTFLIYAGAVVVFLGLRSEQ